MIKFFIYTNSFLMPCPYKNAQNEDEHRNSEKGIYLLSAFSQNIKPPPHLLDHKLAMPNLPIR